MTTTDEKKLGYLGLTRYEMDVLIKALGVAIEHKEELDDLMATQGILVALTNGSQTLKRGRD